VEALSNSLGETLVWMLLNLGFELVLVWDPIFLNELIRFSFIYIIGAFSCLFFSYVFG